MRVYKITGYQLEYKTSRIALTKEEARAIAEEMEREEVYRWVNITMKIVHTPKQLDALESYLASLGV
jgi:hypothetical protein